MLLTPNIQCISPPAASGKNIKTKKKSIIQKKNNQITGRHNRK